MAGTHFRVNPYRVAVEHTNNFSHFFSTSELRIGDMSENASRQWVRRLPDSLMSQAIVCAGQTRRVWPGVRNCQVERAGRATDGVARKAAAQVIVDAASRSSVCVERTRPLQRWRR